MTEAELKLITRIATCHTEGCGNADIAIPVRLVDNAATVQCGVCGQAVTDVADASKEGNSNG